MKCMKRFMICTPHLILLAWSSQEGCDGLGMWHVRGRSIHTGFLWGNLKERDHLEDLKTDEGVILKHIFNTQEEKVWPGFTWLRRGTGGGLL
jgi:hypothetical protein